jgi:MFS family permease
MRRSNPRPDPVTGRVSDRIGRIPGIIIGLLVCAIALPLIFRSESLTAFVLLAPLLGLGVGAVTPVTNALIAETLARQCSLPK